MLKELLPPFWHIRKKTPPLPTEPLDPELEYDDTHPLISQPDYVPEGKKLVLEAPDPKWVAIVQALCDSRP